MIQNLNQLARTILVVLVFAAPAAALAQSSARLPVIGFAPGGEQLASDCQKHWEGCHKYCDTVIDLVSNNQFDKIKMNQLGPMNVVVQQLERASRRLSYLREPASVDYRIRADYCLRATDAAIADRLKTFKQGVQLETKAEKYKVKSRQKRQKDLVQVRELLAEGKVDQAEQAMEKILMDIDQYSPWLTSKSQVQLSNQVDPIRRSVNQATIKKRESETAAALSAAIKSNSPNIDSLLGQVETAITSIGSTGTAKIGDGEALAGHAALKQLFVQWQTAHQKLTQCMTLDQLGKGLKLTVEPADVIGTKLYAADWKDAAKKLDEKMTELLPKLVAADMKRSRDETAARSSYLRYLSTIGFMANKSADAMVAGCEQELLVLESRPGTLATSIKSYKKATADMLLWKKRSATALAATAKTNPGPESTAALPAREYFIPDLNAGLNQLGPALKSQATKLQAVARNVQLINEKAGYSSLQTDTWTTVIGEFDIEDELTKLRGDLFISPESPPLSPAAAKSVLTAKRKHMAAIGGNVSGAQVEAMATRFAKLPASMTSFVPLKEVPFESLNVGTGLLRVNVTPTWVQHDHFFKVLK